MARWRNLRLTGLDRNEVGQEYWIRLERQPEARSPGFLGRQRPWATKKKAFLGVRRTPTAWGTLGGIPKREAPRRGLTQRSKAEPDPGGRGLGGGRSRTGKGAGLGRWAGVGVGGTKGALLLALVSVAGFLVVAPLVDRRGITWK